MSINVREARPGDEPHIVRLIRELAGTDDGASPITPEYFQRYLAFTGTHVLLAENEERVIGLLSYSVRPALYHAGDAALIEEPVVHAPERGRGVGSALMTELLRRLAGSGCAEVSVSIMPDNEGAQRFYRAYGLGDEALFLEEHL